MKGICLALSLSLVSLVSASDIKPLASGVGVIKGSKDWVCAEASAAIAISSLQDEHMLDSSKIDNDKLDILMLAKQSLGHGASKQVFRLVFHQTDGKALTAIVFSSTAEGECPYDDVKTYVVGKEM